MLVCVPRKSPPSHPAQGPGRRALSEADELSAESLKVAKEPRWHFLECIYSHLLSDIKIGLSWRQMTESFKDSYCLFPSWVCFMCEMLSLHQMEKNRDDIVWRISQGRRAPCPWRCHNASWRRVVNTSSHTQGPNVKPRPAVGWTQMLDVRVRDHLCFQAACTTSFLFHRKSQPESFHPAEGRPRRCEGNSDALEGLTVKTVAFKTGTLTVRIKTFKNTRAVPESARPPSQCHLVSQGVLRLREHRTGAWVSCDAPAA